MREFEVYRKIKKEICTNNNNVVISRIESMTSEGFPDSIIFFGDKTILCEFKILLKGLIYMRPAQYNFAINLEKIGGKYNILVYDNDTKDYFLIKKITNLIKKEGNSKYIIIDLSQNYILPEKSITKITEELLNV